MRFQSSIAAVCKMLISFSSQQSGRVVVGELASVKGSEEAAQTGSQEQSG